MKAPGDSELSLEPFFSARIPFDYCYPLVSRGLKSFDIRIVYAINQTPLVRSKAMYPSVKEVVPRDDYTLFVVFENGENGILDMKPILDFGVFQRIKGYENFR